MKVRKMLLTMVALMTVCFSSLATAQWAIEKGERKVFVDETIEVEANFGMKPYTPYNVYGNG